MASERRYVTRCWAGRARPTKAVAPQQPPTSDARSLRPNTAGRKPRVWAYSSADLAREAGASTLASLSRAARQYAIDLANPFQAVGLIAWSRRKELAHAGTDVAALLAGLSTLDERSSLSWPLGSKVRPAASPLRVLAERARRAAANARVGKPARDDDELYLPRPRLTHGRS